MRRLEETRARGERETRAATVAVISLNAVVALLLWLPAGRPVFVSLLVGVLATPLSMLAVAACTEGAMWFAREIGRRGEEAALDIFLDGGRLVLSAVLFIGGIWAGPSVVAWLIHRAFR